MGVFEEKKLLCTQWHEAITPQDIEMYLERIARGKPLSAQAGKMSGEELADYIARIREKKE